MMDIMFGIIFFLVSLTAGYSAVSWCVPRWNLSVRLAAGSVVGIACGGWIGFLLSLAFGLTAGLALTAGVLLAVSVAGYRFWPASITKLRVWAVLGGLAIGLPALWLYVSHALTVQSDGWYVPGYTWGDLPFHMGIMSEVAYQAHVPLTFPVFYQAPLSYPFLIDFYSGILLRYGAGWQLSVLLPGIVLFLSACYLSFHVVRSFISPKAGYLQLLLFLLAGSPAGLSVFWQAFRANGWSAVAAADYSNLTAQNLDFANPVTSHFLPQRSFLIGFAMAMAILALLVEYLQKQPDRRVLVLAAVLTGLLPLAHAHTFLVMAVLWAMLIVSQWYGKSKVEPVWWHCLVIIALLASPQLFWQFHTTYHAGFGSWYFGWVRAPGESIWYFWWQNVGLFLPLLFLTPWAVKKMENRFLTSLYLVGLIVAVAVNVRLFQPNAWDNMKLILYSYWILLIPVVWMLRWLWQHKLGVVTLVIAVALTGSGLLAVLREMSPQVNYRLYSSDDLSAASELRAVLPVDANVLIMPDHNDIVPTLTGRHVLSGYAGWLWTYGIDYTQQETARNLILAGTPSAGALIAQYKLTDFVISDAQIAKYDVPLATIRSLYPEIYNRYGWHVFYLPCSSRTVDACGA